MMRIGLKDAITALRTELSESISAALPEELRFEVGEITLEFKVEVERTGEASAGIKFWVVDVGGKGTQSSGTTHTITIPLKPITRGGQPILTGDQTGKVPDR
jgi:hypothetical protein